jgi:hypothetical protein
MSWGHITRNAHLWLPGYLQWRAGRPSRPPARLWLTIADHYEPYWKNADEQTAQARVAEWRQRWPRIAARHRDSAGRPPVYTFFYPQDQYRPSALDPLAEMTAQGIADVEVHIHHGGEGQQVFVDRMSEFIEALSRRHGLLRKTPVPNGSGHRSDKVRFGFIHGNWALDNSRPDGIHCGLNNELILLRDLGCYADFTLPAVPDPAQAGLINTIYWATDDPDRPRSHETGQPVRPGANARGDLLIVPGPLHLNWHDRPFWKPRIETGELAGNDRVRPERFALWFEAAPRIGGDAFLKLYAHGAPEKNARCLLGTGNGSSAFEDSDLDQLCYGIIGECQRNGVELHFASAWEMYQAIEAASRS